MLIRCHIKIVLFAFTLSFPLGAHAQQTPPLELPDKPGQSQGAGPIQPLLKPEKRDYVQELDSDAAALAKIPPDPLLKDDPLRFVLKPIDDSASALSPSKRLVFGATYTFLNQYATIAPDGVRHNQTSGRLDFSGSFVAYDHESTAGSFSLLVRSGTNIGYSQQWNLSDALGSGIYLNCLQGGGAQRPVTLNVLYYRQDFLAKRLSFYMGKLHPNQYISLSMYNNDERTQFLNGENDGNLAIASDGTYAGGGAVEFQATKHIYFHVVAVDTEGSQQSNLKTMANLKYLEAAETGWFSGSPGTDYTNLRFVLWRDDTASQGSGYGGGFAFEHEYQNGWAPFGRFGFATETGTTIKQTDTLGVVQTHPWGRRGDMFGASFSYTEPTHTGKHHESIFETFYRLRLAQSINIGPDLEVSIHPTYAAKAYTTTLLSARMEIIF
jgi:porin